MEMGKRTMLVIFSFITLVSKGQTGIGFELGIISGGLGGNTVTFMNNNDGSTNAEIGLWYEHTLSNSLGLGVKLVYNSYNLSGWFQETTIPVFLKFVAIEGGGRKFDCVRLIAGPQLGFYKTYGIPLDQPGSGTDYSYVLGAELGFHDGGDYLSIYYQGGLTNFSYDNSTMKIHGLTIALGKFIMYK